MSKSSRSAKPLPCNHTIFTDGRRTLRNSMNRRRFLSASVAAGAVASASKAQLEGPNPQYTQEDVRHAPGFHLPAFEFDELTTQQFHARLKQRSLTIERMAELYLERIDQIDRRGPQLRSVIELNPD